IPMSNVIVDEDGVGCLTKGTKVLTCDGWRNVENIKVGDLVYSKDCNNNLIKSKVIGNKKREKTKILVDESGINFSFSHFLPVKTRKEYEYKNKSWDYIEDKRQIYLDTYYKYSSERFSFRLDATKYKMHNGRYKKLNNIINISDIELASFLGYFLSEGCIDSHKYIKITQNNDSPCYYDIIRVVSNLGLSVYESQPQKGRKNVDITICHKGLVKWLKRECYDGNEFRSWKKKIPKIIKNADSVVIDEFLRTFNLGDGYIHKGQRQYVTGSKQLCYDLHEMILKTNKLATIHIKSHKGSISYIHGRKITRKRDIYLISELKEDSATISPKVINEYEDHVYNLEIDSSTKLYMVMFDGKQKKPFFVHNGGVKDILNCKGFVNNSRAENGENFGNLKSQCYWKLAEIVNNNKMYVDCLEPSIQEMITEELEQVKGKEILTDNKQKVISKDKVKELIGRSPDYSDMLMMRMYFELKPQWTQFVF